MPRVGIPLTAAAMGLAVGVAARAQGSAGFELATARFRPGTAGDSTRLCVSWRIPRGILHPIDTDPARRPGYRVTLAVHDSMGREVVRRSWLRVEPESILSRAAAGAPEHAWLTLAAGRYRIALTVTDSASGRSSRGELSIEALAPDAVASDLLLGRSARDAGPGDTLDRLGELRVGSVVLQGAPWPQLPPGRATLAYYAELYRATGVAVETAIVSLRVEHVTGRRRLRGPIRAVPLAEPAAVVRGLLDLGHLPRGPYRLVLTARIGTDSVIRSAPFTIEESDDPFAGATEARLDTLYEPLIYVIGQDERGIYSALPTEGKRDYLRRFWVRRDRTPGTPRNEARDSFYADVGRVNHAFREGGAAEIPGWRTDRGRIYLKNGPPDEVLSRPQPGGTLPYEVWKYTRGKLRKYVFLDVTRFGNYALIYTNDLGEVSRPDWQRLLGQEALEDVARF